MMTVTKIKINSEIQVEIILLIQKILPCARIFHLEIQKTFNKPAIDLQQQLKRFEQNGLVIDDRESFAFSVKTIGYYRLKGYLLSYKDFPQSITSSQLLSTYAFDRKLRLLFLDAIERIEIALKAIVNDHMSLTYDPF